MHENTIIYFQFGSEGVTEFSLLPWHVNLWFLPNESVHDGKINLVEHGDVNVTLRKVLVQCAAATDV